VVVLDRFFSSLLPYRFLFPQPASLEPTSHSRSGLPPSPHLSARPFPAGSSRRAKIVFDMSISPLHDPPLTPRRMSPSWPFVALPAFPLQHARTTSLGRQRSRFFGQAGCVTVHSALFVSDRPPRNDPCVTMCPPYRIFSVKLRIVCSLDQ